MIDNPGEMHWVVRRVHPILPCMKLYWDGFGLSYKYMQEIYDQLIYEIKQNSQHGQKPY